MSSDNESETTTNIAEQFRDTLASLQYIQYLCSVLIAHKRDSEGNFLDTAGDVVKQQLEDMENDENMAKLVPEDSPFRTCCSRIQEGLKTQEALRPQDIADIYCCTYSKTIDFYRRYDKYVAPLSQFRSVFVNNTDFFDGLRNFDNSISSFQSQSELYVNEMFDLALKECDEDCIKKAAEVFCEAESCSEKLVALFREAKGGTMKRFAVQRRQYMYYQKLGIRHALKDWKKDTEEE